MPSVQYVEFKQYNFTFEVGKDYENALGIYTVKSIMQNDDGTYSLTVEYKTGNIYPARAGYVTMYNALGQAQSMYKIKREKEQPMRKRMSKRMNKIPGFISDKELFTLGYLAKYGYIQARVGPKSIDTFPSDFTFVTGEKVKKFEGHGYYAEIDSEMWSYGLSITFPIPDEVTLQYLQLPNSLIIREDRCEINSNDYVWGLFQKGFLPGKNNMNERRIREIILPGAKDEFMKGFSL